MNVKDAVYLQFWRYTRGCFETVSSTSPITEFSCSFQQPSPSICSSPTQYCSMFTRLFRWGNGEGSWNKEFNSTKFPNLFGKCAIKIKCCDESEFKKTAMIVNSDEYINRMTSYHFLCDGWHSVYVFFNVSVFGDGLAYICPVFTIQIGLLNLKISKSVSAACPAAWVSILNNISVQVVGRRASTSR